MFTLDQMFAITLVLCLTAAVSCKGNASDVTDVEKNSVNTNPSQTPVLTQLRSHPEEGPSTYTYKCTVGSYHSNRLACTARDSTSWAAPHNVELKLRCPNSGSGLTLSYVEIVYSVSSASVNCYVHEGAVGLGYIGVTINAWNTLAFSYTANFYSY